MTPFAYVPLYAVYGAYGLLVFVTLVNGYTREVIGHRHGSRLHRFFWQVHTGLHINPRRSYGDDPHLKRAAGATNRATPEGLMVYWTPRSRRYRAARNNLIVLAILSGLYGLAAYPRDTAQGLAVLVPVVLLLLVVHRVQVVRRRRPPVWQNPQEKKPALSGSKKAKLVLAQDRPVPGSMPARAMEAAARPQLVSGVPQPVIATLLAGSMNVSSAEIMAGLTMTPEQGRLVLPDTFAALVKQREPVQEIIEAHTEGKVSFAWRTTTSPRMLVWTPIRTGLPTLVRFREYLQQIEGCKPGTFAVGLDANGTMYVADHNGDTPWHCTSAGSGTGKSTRFLVKAAQIAHQDPRAEIYCIDTKQISFRPLRGIPGIHIFDNPVSEMQAIWEVFYSLEGIMRDRYAAVREGRARLADFTDIWVLVDEGNDLSGHLKNYWTRRVKKSGDPAQPVIWSQAIGPLIRTGREARMRGEFMLQDLTDRALGGESLKMGFSVFGMADWKKSQWDRIIGPPAPPVIKGQGKILMVRGTEQTWIQGLWDDEQWLHDYALAGRKDMEEAS